MNFKYILELICRWISGGVFIYASASKVFNPCQFALDIYHYQLTPAFLLNIAAIILPWAEMLLGVSIILGIAPRGAALGIILILMIFIGALTINFIRGIDFECGCFGSGKDLCEIVSEWFQAKYPASSSAAVLKVRVGCDIIRDLLLLIPVILGLSLMQKRLTAR